MPARRPTPSELRGARPVFALVVSWLGRDHRFATEPLLVTLDSGSVIRFSGSLDLRGYVDSMGRPGTAELGGSASMGVEFEGINLVQEYLQGRILEGATCELSMLFVRAGAVSTVWENRIVQLSGVVSRPQVGFHDRPVGFAALTVVSRPFDDQTPILRSQDKITKISQPDSAADYYGGVYPLVLGSPGDANTPGSPGYLIKTTPTDRRVLIGVGRQAATKVIVADEDGVKLTQRDVLHKTDGLGNVYAYVSVSGATGSFNKADGKHYIHWTNLGVDQFGYRNPFGSGGLTKTPDVFRYFLGLTSNLVDGAAWVSSRPIFDRYTFGGYIDDPSVTVWSFLSSQLLPLLPMNVRIGPDGLYPISLFYSHSVGNLPQITIDPLEGMVQISPVQITKQIRDVVNGFALSYYHNAKENRLSRQLVATPDQNVSDRVRVEASQRSREIYGAREGAEVEGSYVDNDRSAQQILRWLLLDRGFLHMAVQVKASPRYGWITVGDHISLTAERLGMTGRRAVVTSKSWDGDAWRYVFAWSLAPMEATL